MGVHVRADGAVEVLGELVHVGKGADDAEAAGRVEAGGNAKLQGFGAVRGAPRVGGAHPEEL